MEYLSVLYTKYQTIRTQRPLTIVQIYSPTEHAEILMDKLEQDKQKKINLLELSLTASSLEAETGKICRFRDGKPLNYL